MVHKYIFQLIVHMWLRFHKRHSRIDVYIGRQYILDYQHMDDLPNIDRSHKHHLGMDYQANQVDIYMLDRHALQYIQRLDRSNSHYIL